MSSVRREPRGSPLAPRPRYRRRQRLVTCIDEACYSRCDVELVLDTADSVRKCHSNGRVVWIANFVRRLIPDRTGCLDRQVRFGMRRRALFCAAEVEKLHAITREVARGVPRVWVRRGHRGILREVGEVDKCVRTNEASTPVPLINGLRELFQTKVRVMVPCKQSDASPEKPGE
jgi:hypothetical protein